MLRPKTLVVDGGGNFWVVESASDRRDCYWFWLRYNHGNRKFYFRNDSNNKRLKLMMESDVSIPNPDDWGADHVNMCRSIL